MRKYGSPELGDSSAAARYAVSAPSRFLFSELKLALASVVCSAKWSPISS